LLLSLVAWKARLVLTHHFSVWIRIHLRWLLALNLVLRHARRQRGS
jgi:hypothetical protein